MSVHSLETIGARMDRLPTSIWHYKVIILLGLGVLCDTLDIYIGGAVIAALLVEGWSNITMNGYFISATMGGMMIGALIAGFVGDALGRRKSFLMNLIIFGGASLVAAFVSDMTQLIIVRGIMGIGLGAQMAATTGSLAEYFQPANRGRYSSIVGLIANVAPPITMGLSALVIPIYGWRPLFFGIGCLAVIVWFLIAKYLPESPRWCITKGLFDKANEIVTKVEREIEARKNIKLPPIVETVAVAEKPKAVPYSVIFKGGLLPRTIALSALFVSTNVAIYTIVNWVPTIFIQAGISITKSLTMTVVMLIGAPFGVFVCSLIADKFPRKVSLTLLAFLIGLLGYVYSLQRAEMLIMGVGFLMISVLYYYTILIFYVYAGEMYPTEARLRGVGFCNAVGRVSGVITPPMVAFVLVNYGSGMVFMALFAIMTIVALLVAKFGVETRNKSVEEINKGLIEAAD